MIALAYSMGGLGAIAASAPLELALRAYSWREIFAFLAAFTLLLSAIFALLVPEHPGAHKPGKLREQLAGLAAIARDGAFWRVALAIGSTQCAVVSLFTLWVTAWLRDVAGYDPAAALADGRISQVDLNQPGLAGLRGLVFNPATPLHYLDHVMDKLDMILLMSVNPGFGGQAYIPGSTAKIARLRTMLDQLGSQAELEVDGGINTKTVAEVISAGATVLVAGSAIFNNRAPIAENIRQLRSHL